MHTNWDELPYEEPELVKVLIAKLSPPWQRRAECRRYDPAMFFGGQEETRSMSPRQIREAAKICDECPVFASCLRSALEQGEQYGVWAGTSGRVRQRIQRMLVFGVVTIDEVVKDYCNGKRSRYEGQEEKRVIDEDLGRRRQTKAQGSYPGGRDGGVQAAQAG